MSKVTTSAAQIRGPWEKGDGDKTHDGGWYCEIYDADGDVAASVNMIYGYKDRVEANACLIAAAPELLLAAKEAALLLRDLSKLTGHSVLEVYKDSPCFQHLMDAINKAE